MPQVAAGSRVPRAAAAGVSAVSAASAPTAPVDNTVEVDATRVA